MSFTNYAYKSICLYVIIFFSPLIVTLLNFSKGQTIYFSTISYLVGASLLLALNYQQPAKNAIEKKQASTSTSTIIKWGFFGIFLVFIVQVMASQLEQVLFHTSPNSANTKLIVNIIKRYPIYALAVSFAAPVMEELVFRRALTGLLSQHLPPLIGAMISSLLFATAHGDGHILIYFTIGMTFYYLYQKTGSIWSPIIAHCAMNFIVLSLQVFAQPLLN